MNCLDEVTKLPALTLESRIFPIDLNITSLYCALESGVSPLVCINWLEEE